MPRLVSQAKDRLDWPRAGLSARSRRVARAAAEAILADEDDAGAIVAASAEACDRAVAALDRSVGRASADLRRAFGVLSFLLDWLPIFIIGAFSRMSRLPIARRVRYLEALEAHPVGLFPMLLVAFKIPLSIPAFEEAEELALTGFDRPDIAAPRRLPAEDRSA